MRHFVPVTPDPDTAQRWAEDELAKGIYRSGESLLERIGRELSEMLNKFLQMSDGAGVPPVGYLLGALVLIGLLVIAARIASPAVRQRRRAAKAVMDADDLRTASAMRGDAENALKAGDLSAATLDAFRAIVRGCEERLVIDERAGRTAREAARDIGRALPDASSELGHAHAVFDQVCYGHRDATLEDASAMLSLESRVRGLKPTLVAA